MEDSAQIAEDIQKKQSQIDNLQAQINALSAKEEKIDSLSGQIEKAIEDINTANFDLETQRIALETLETNHSAQVSKTEANQATQSQIDALTVETLNNAIENAQAEIRSINAELSAAQALLATPALSAKADGVVTLVSYTEGDTVPAGKSVVTIGDSGEKCVAAEIPQEDIGGVELGQAVELQFVADPDNTISGRVVEKNLVPTQGTEGVTYTVKIAFDEPQEELLQGMTCSVKFIQKRVENVLTLANKAITLTDGKQTVIVQMADGSHEEREIKTGFSDGRTSEVTSGLSAGEIVVVAG
jgi:RND family efflux transporter MFP subunit